MAKSGLSILCAAALAFSLTACGTAKNEDNSAPSNEDGSEDNTQDASEKSEDGGNSSEGDGDEYQDGGDMPDSSEPPSDIDETEDATDSPDVEEGDSSLHDGGNDLTDAEEEPSDSSSPADSEEEEDIIADKDIIEEQDIGDDIDASDEDVGELEDGGSDDDVVDSGVEDVGGNTDVGGGEEKYIKLASPANGAKFVQDRAVVLKGETNCSNAQVIFLADGKYKFGETTVTAGAFEYSYAFNTPGLNREITVRAELNGVLCAETTVAITVQQAYAYLKETLKDKNGCSYELHTVLMPTADDRLDIAGSGAGSAKTVKAHAESISAHNPIAVVNGGYFGSVPLSYAKGHLGYNASVGNTKGPRACFVYDRNLRAAKIELSMGREYLGGDSWGKELFPEYSDVVCAGPKLVEGGKNVFAAHYTSENFETSGINPNNPNPRSGVGIKADGSVMLLMAQSPSVKACGLTLPELAETFIKKGCVEAMNFDGGGSSAMWVKENSVSYFRGTEDRAVFQVLLVRKLK